MRVKRILAVVAAVACLGLTDSDTASLTVSSVTAGGTCTDGDNCFCDTVTAPDASSILFCEDWEAAQLYDLSAGHWVDNDPGEERGQDSYWLANYGTPGENFWASGEPNASPRIGDQCSPVSGSGCDTPKEYCSTEQGNLIDGQGADCWEANTDVPEPFIDIVRDDDFHGSFPTSGDVTAPGGQVGAFGTQALRAVVPAAEAPDNNGPASWTVTDNSVGITGVMAYASNISSSNLQLAPWKHLEFSPDGGVALGSALLGFDSEGNFPLEGFVTCDNGSGGAEQCVDDGGTCSCPDPTAGNETGTLIGTFQQTNRWKWEAEATDFDFSTDWGTHVWGCIRTKITGFGTANTCITQWYSTDGTETVWADFCVDGTEFIHTGTGGIESFIWNWFANTNQSSAPTADTTEASGRWHDNLVVTDGDPVTCADALESS